MNIYLKFYECSDIMSSVTPCEVTVDMKRVVRGATVPEL